MITSGSGTPADAVELWDREIQKWKTQHPDEFQNYAKWAAGGSRRRRHESTRRRRRRRRALWPYLYALPAVAAMAFAFGYPLVQVVRDSFYAGNFDSPIWVGTRQLQGRRRRPGRSASRC